MWLEITEGALAADTESTLGVLRRLRSLGLRLAIDDFGTGYASLGYLKSFPVEVLKIDRSFIVGLGTGKEDAAIVRSVISLARSLGLECVAEGIERPQQLEELRALGCTYVQGFLLGVPLPADVLGDQSGRRPQPVDRRRIGALRRAPVAFGVRPSRRCVGRPSPYSGHLRTPPGSGHRPPSCTGGTTP